MNASVRRFVLTDGERIPLVIEASNDVGDLMGYVVQNRMEIETLLLEHGALLFRGFSVDTTAKFDNLISRISNQRLPYLYRSTPRSAVGNNIFTATEYPATEEIPLHNENAYQREWPKYVLFCCLEAASSGGETPLADMRKVTFSIGEALTEKFLIRKVKYIRTYRQSFDLPWQTVFQTQDRDAVAKYCDRHDIRYEWLDLETLRTYQICQGVVRHPVTRDLLFFNQAHLFHVSSIGSGNARTLIKIFGEDRVPRQARFGDDSSISDEELVRIRNAFQQHAVKFTWRRGDILFLDNMQAAHGRRSYKGKRVLLAALLDVVSNEQCDKGI
jgi:alpha-ketoglutarate-dependent taurine dioxygenase